ncbi:hotdog family protein [Algoriphagus chordae]|uniref:3-hydroxyacyl-[acyl-carrier-protein] dehydratase n=1 Tax=Algoriphagus chordae TaxID=237019 RepID=A0A2W7QRR4_9BACT|nr:3-hydroxyacyl-ACP dehydratase [Algoriphagus chordae]PZX48720.1 3-hydroxyacyl-[acyl-carrier-protein] dehydratase [Algoriphagus chordae]
MLTNFYTLNSISTEGNQTKALITINKDHEVFLGHFPGNPVTPGVCMMHIIKELTEQVVGKKLFMQSSNNIKFLALINPEKTPDLTLDISIVETEEGYKVRSETRFLEILALKLSSLYIVK